MRLTDALHINRVRQATKTALIFDAVRQDWRTLVDRIARLAGVFTQEGLEPGGRVAILLRNGPAYVEALYAAVWAGGVGVPLNWRLQPADLAKQLEAAQPTLLLCDHDWSDRLAAVLDGRRTPHRVIVVDAADDAAAVPPVLGYERAMAGAGLLPDRSGGGTDLAFIFYTGGTTGDPKGVMLSHDNVWANSAAVIAHLNLETDLVHLHCGPMFHIGTANKVFLTTIVGGTHVILDRFTRAGALAAIRENGVTLASFVPTMLAMILEDGVPSPADVGSLRLIAYGASPMPPSLLARLMNAFPHVAFAQTYGMTELSPVVSMLRPSDHTATDETSRRRLGSAGQPVFTAAVRIVDERDDDCPRGEAGEIVVRGPMVMLGYWRDAEATGRALRGGWMHTGDVGFLDEDGYLFVTDRIKDMIISGGENVYSLEVENAIVALPGVKGCAVVGLPDETWGERVHAVAIVQDGAALTADDVREHCRALLAGYKVPKSVRITSAPLPLTQAGKVDKATLRRNEAV